MSGTEVIWPASQSLIGVPEMNLCLSIGANNVAHTNFNRPMQRVPATMNLMPHFVGPPGADLFSKDSAPVSSSSPRIPREVDWKMPPTLGRAGPAG